MPSHYLDPLQSLSPTFGDDPFQNFLTDVPEAAYFSTPQFQGATPNLRSFLQTGFRDFHNEFLGALGAQIKGGNLPTLRFPEFLQDMPFQQRFQESRFAPRQSRSRFAPQTRFTYPF